MVQTTKNLKSITQSQKNMMTMSPRAEFQLKARTNTTMFSQDCTKNQRLSRSRKNKRRRLSSRENENKCTPQNDSQQAANKSKNPIQVWSPREILAPEQAQSGTTTAQQSKAKHLPEECTRKSKIEKPQTHLFLTSLKKAPTKEKDKPHSQNG